MTVTGTTTALPQAPGIPQHLTAVPDNGAVDLTWSAPLTGGAVTGYRIERAVAADSRVWADAVVDTGTLEVSWNDSGLTAATVYHYRVTARSAAGLGAAGTRVASVGKGIRTTVQ